MRPLITLTLVCFSASALSQTKIDKDIVECVSKAYSNDVVNLRKTLYDFEEFLIKNKYLRDKSGESYIAVYERIVAEGDLNIQLGDFDDKGLLKQSPTAFYDCYDKRIPEIQNSDSPLKKMYDYFQNQNESLEPITPAKASQHLLNVLKPNDFGHEVIKLRSLYSFLRLTESAYPSPSANDEEYVAQKKFKKEMIVLLEKESKIYVNKKLTALEKLSDSLAKFITPSRDTLKRVVLQMTKDALYKDAISIRELIQSQFQISRDKLSVKLYQQIFSELNKEKKGEIRYQLPIDIEMVYVK